MRLNGKAGITVKSGAEVVLAGNSILDGKATGLYVYDAGKAHMTEGNKIERNAFHGVAVRDGGVLEMTGCKLCKNGQNGLFVYAKGLATVERCEITGSGNVGVVICEESQAEVSHCKISQSGFEGVWMYERGQGKVLHTDLRGNSKPIRNDDDCELEQSSNKLL